MCSLTVGLMAAQMGMQLYQGNQQAKAQQAQYKIQARQAELNKSYEEHAAEKQAENYAMKQQQLNDKFKLATGNARAQFGASGLDSQGGSLEDVLNASTDAYIKDSQNLLANQREDSWASYVKQTNYLNEMNAYNTAAHNAKVQNRINQFGTLLNGAASIYGQGFKEGLWGQGSKTATNVASPFVQNGYNATATASLAQQNFSYTGIPVKKGYNTFSWGMR